MNASNESAFEDLQVGDRWESDWRAITAQDLHEFAELTGDKDPLHTDPEFAAKTPFGQLIAHGLLGLSFMAGLSSQFPRVKTIAFVGIQDWQFLKPIFVGDQIRVKNEVRELLDYGRRHGKVIWRRQIENQHGTIVQEGTLITLVSRREPLRTRVDKASQFSAPHASSEAQTAIGVSPT